jgi:hypothetical protein
MDYLAAFSGMRLQVKFYDYALGLLDFDYQSRNFKDTSAKDL